MRCGVTGNTSAPGAVRLLVRTQAAQLENYMERNEWEALQEYIEAEIEMHRVKTKFSGEVSRMEAETRLETAKIEVEKLVIED
jgi:hypothetical protein